MATGDPWTPGCDSIAERVLRVDSAQPVMIMMMMIIIIIIISNK
jgi:hypothetical protein